MRCVLAVTVSLSLCSASLALAQDVEEARQHFAEAEVQFEAGRYALALQGFQRAHALLRSDPRAPAILYNVGQCQVRLGQNEAAIESFERYLAEAPSIAPFRESTVDLLRDLRARVAIDASRTAADPPAADPPATDAPATTNRDGGITGMEVGGLVIAGVGVVTALGAIPTGVLALDGEASLARTCAASGACPESQRGRLDETRTLSVVTDVLWIGGLSLAAVGAAVFAIGTATRPSVGAAAFCTEAGCVGSVSARF